jgi:hypothetical protein
LRTEPGSSAATAWAWIAVSGTHSTLPATVADIAPPAARARTPPHHLGGLAQSGRRTRPGPRGLAREPDIPAVARQRGIGRHGRLHSAFTRDPDRACAPSATRPPGLSDRSYARTARRNGQHHARIHSRPALPVRAPQSSGTRSRQPDPALPSRPRRCQRSRRTTPYRARRIVLGISAGPGATPRSKVGKVRVVTRARREHHDVRPQRGIDSQPTATTTQKRTRLGGTPPGSRREKHTKGRASRDGPQTASRHRSRAVRHGRPVRARRATGVRGRARRRRRHRGRSRPARGAVA